MSLSNVQEALNVSKVILIHEEIPRHRREMVSYLCLRSHKAITMLVEPALQGRETSPTHAIALSAAVSRHLEPGCIQGRQE